MKLWRMIFLYTSIRVLADFRLSWGSNENIGTSTPNICEPPYISNTRPKLLKRSNVEPNRPFSI